VKKVALLVCVALSAAIIASVVWFANDFVAPLFLNSRIERLDEKDLPKASVEKGGIIHCRMKADDFRFPLPQGASVLPPILISGGFDTVDGSVEVRFEGSRQVTPSEYENWLSSRLQVGGQVTAKSVPGGLSIKFHYFGDK